MAQECYVWYVLNTVFRIPLVMSLRKSWMPFMLMLSWAPPATSALRIMNSGLFKKSETVSTRFFAHPQGYWPFVQIPYLKSKLTCLRGSKTFSRSILAATMEDQKVRVCAEHLRQYSEGLNLSNTIRMCDAFNFLNKYHEEEIKRKTTPDEEHKIQITATERFLFNLFKGIVQ